MPGTPTAGLPLMTVTGTATVKNTAGVALGELPFTCFNTSGLKLGLAATDPNGSGPASLTYAATGAQSIAATTINAASTQPSVTHLV